MEETHSKERNIKGFIIGSIVSFVVTGLLMGLVLMIHFLAKHDLMKEEIYVGWYDALILSSVMMLLFFLLNYLTREGAFDILAYSFKLVWYNTFYRNVRETKLPKTYREYRELKASKPRDSNLFLLVGAAPYLVAGIVVMCVYYLEVI